jgi:hypothetical protein
MQMFAVPKKSTKFKVVVFFTQNKLLEYLKSLVAYNLEPIEFSKVRELGDHRCHEERLIMKSAIRKIVSVAILFSASLSLASQTWTGGVKLYSSNRGHEYQENLDSNSVIYKNIASYQYITLTFEFYKQGVTESGESVWSKVLAEAELVNDATNEVIKKGNINVVGQIGNNAVYEIALNQFQPDTFGELPVELRDRKQMPTHLNIIMDGRQELSIPVVFSYWP